jgi:hypothetical protein
MVFLSKIDDYHPIKKKVWHKQKYD